MSRSRKKKPYVAYEKTDTHYRNKVLRHDKLANFSRPADYKKSTKGRQGWNAIGYYSSEEAREQWLNDPSLQQEYTLEEWLDYWDKHIMRK